MTQKKHFFLSFFISYLCFEASADYNLKGILL